MDPSALLRVHTWQHPAAWAAALDRGYLTGSHGHRDDPDDDLFDAPYEWIRDEMAKVVPDFSGDLPVWAWPKTQNPRRNPYHRRRVRITALVPRARALPSDYELWHLPLNRGNVPLTRAEDDAWDLPHGHPDVRTTWHRVLEIVGHEGAERDFIGSPSIIQLCVDRIRLDEIVSVRHPDGRTGQGRR